MNFTLKSPSNIHILTIFRRRCDLIISFKHFREKYPKLAGCEYNFTVYEGAIIFFKIMRIFVTFLILARRKIVWMGDIFWIKSVVGVWVPSTSLIFYLSNLPVKIVNAAMKTKARVDQKSQNLIPIYLTFFKEYKG